MSLTASTLTSLSSSATLYHPFYKRLVDNRKRKRSRSLVLKVKFLHVSNLLAITQNIGDSLLDWRFKQPELELRLMCQL